MLSDLNVSQVFDFHVNADMCMHLIIC